MKWFQAYSFESTFEENVLLRLEDKNMQIIRILKILKSGSRAYAFNT